MMRETQRRRLLNGARDRGETAIRATVAPLLTRRYKQLGRELRRANLRKRLRQNERRTGLLFKQDDSEGWQDWIDTFSQALYDAMLPVAEEFWSVETKFWLTRAGRPDPVNAAKVIQDYLAREGRQIKRIAEDTRDDTLATITDWYNTDASLPELIDQLEQFYGGYRAETIGRTETSFITSGVSLDMMHQFDVAAWNWDLADEDGEWPCDDCIAMAQGGPYQPGDPMPPLHPRDRCGVVYANADGSELIYGSDLVFDDNGGFERAILVRTGVLLRYNPDQPRDEHGRFAAGGGGGGPKPAAQRYKDYGQQSLESTINDAARLSAQQAQSLSATEKDAALAYVNGRAFTINKNLRDGAPQNERDAATQQGLDSALQKSTLPEHTLVYRGVDSDWGLQVGQTITDKGYVSTALAKEVSDEFATSAGPGGAMFRIRLDAGQRALSMETLGGNPGQSEILLPRGMTFRVESVADGTALGMPIKVYDLSVVTGK